MSYYHRYRGGRGRRRARLRIVLLALALVILCAIAALFFLQDGAMFTADGGTHSAENCTDQVAKVLAVVFPS